MEFLLFYFCLGQILQSQAISLRHWPEQLSYMRNQPSPAAASRVQSHVVEIMPPAHISISLGSGSLTLSRDNF